ncbi:hypothetical protein HF086_014636 [Spodoptera exigua]|uniref:Uncharacterized protein n=1 Tax=Spodoptera exigua TaxID=7107 RepID=A0A922M687_SPOEX|nr:hypothetical protein HF086_014636 [Spodoptera exigua]
MSRRMLACVIVGFLAVAVTCDEATNATDVVATTTRKPIPYQDSNICKLCKCEDTKVDCYDQSITTFFTKKEWEDIIDLKPSTVDLSENRFVNITVIADLTIEVLNLSRCNIEFIENGSFRDLQEMRVLDLSHNKLTSSNLSPHAFEGRFAPEEYEPLASMRILNLAYNDLHSLNQDLFEHMPELEELDLSGNPLTTIDHVTLVAISSLPMLKVLRMRSCELDEIPSKFLHTPLYLENLDLSDNKLTAVPQELEEAKNLVYLNLNQNPISQLDMNSEDNPSGQPSSLTLGPAGEGGCV